MKTQTYFRDLHIETRRERTGQTFPASLSSDVPILRNFGWEILSHDPGAIVLDRAAQGLPLLVSHATDRLNIGRAVNCRAEGGRLRADLRLGASARAQEICADIENGTLGPLSLGYEILEIEEQAEEREGRPVFIAIRWRPLEVSLEAVPADLTVGINRSAPHEIQKEEIPMETIITATDSGAKAERHRVQDIREYQKIQGDIPDALIDKAIETGQTIHATAKAYMAWKREHQGEAFATKPTTLGLSPVEADRFSIVRAVRALTSNDWSGAGYEREVSTALAQKRGGDLSHIHIPLEVLGTQSRALAKTGSGQYMIGTEHASASFIDVLRNSSRCIEAGATQMNGLVGDVEIPRKTAASSAYWVAEAVDVTESTPTFGQILLQPKTMGALVSYSRKMLLQSSPDIEMLLRNDLAATLAVELDRVCIEGSGTGAEPTGILATSGIGDVICADPDGAAPTFQDMVDLVAAVAAGNADRGRLAFMLSSVGRAKLQTTEKIATTGNFVFENGLLGAGSIAGYPAIVSNNVPDDLTKGAGSALSAIIFGNWADLLIASWGCLELALDNSTNFASGGTRIRALMDTDVAVRHAASFAACLDASC